MSTFKLTLLIEFAFYPFEAGPALRFPGLQITGTEKWMKREYFLKNGEQFAVGLGQDLSFVINLALRSVAWSAYF